MLLLDPFSVKVPKNGEVRAVRFSLLLVCSVAIFLSTVLGNKLPLIYWGVFMPIFTKMFCIMLAFLHNQEKPSWYYPFHPPHLPTPLQHSHLLNLVSSQRCMADFSDLQRRLFLGRVLTRGSSSPQSTLHQGLMS